MGGAYDAKNFRPFCKGKKNRRSIASLNRVHTANIAQPICNGGGKEESLRDHLNNLGKDLRSSGMPQTSKRGK